MPGSGGLSQAFERQQARGAPLDRSSSEELGVLQTASQNRDTLHCRKGETRALRNHAAALGLRCETNRSMHATGAKLCSWPRNHCTVQPSLRISESTRPIGHAEHLHGRKHDQRRAVSLCLYETWCRTVASLIAGRGVFWTSPCTEIC